jgi:hypothetical protein
VHIQRLNRGYTDRNFVYAPKFPKPQQESWFVFVSDTTGQRILGLQRLILSGRGGGEENVDIEISNDFVGDSLVIKVLSDGWRGIDVEEKVIWRPTDMTV